MREPPELPLEKHMPSSTGSRAVMSSAIACIARSESAKSFFDSTESARMQPSRSAPET